MSLPNEPTFQTLQFYATAAYPCSYLPDKLARSQVAAPTHLIDTAAYSKLIRRGFRRSGLFTYRPHCDNCQACLPIRVDASGFQPGRTQQRTWRRHRELQARVLPLLWSEEHYAMYRRYQRSRHPGAGMDEDDANQYREFLLTSRVDSRLVEFRLPSGELQMVSLIDLVEDGISAVYTFFDPDARGSLGTYGVLWQIEYCRRHSLPWLYLGYWIRESRKMAYKNQYRPFQVLSRGAWAEDGGD
ncbi:arginyltransferase [Paracandidimonas soli]|uniref:arginyltransferase n=1 Tax=Paracandidimonas soli TaxID=1917182 RepID=UPI003342ADEB